MLKVVVKLKALINVQI